MNLIQCYLRGNDCYTTGRTITPKGVMVHSTGANNPKVARYVQPSDNDPNKAQLLKTIGTNKNANDWNHGGLDVCVHAFLGKLADGGVGTVQTLPWDHRGWHAGNGTSGKSANDTHISFEICEDALTDADYFQKVYREAVELTAMLCKTYNLNPLADGVVICHSEGYRRGVASNHGDVMHWFPKFGKSMDTFRSDVAKILGTSEDKPAAEKPQEPSGYVTYTVRAGDTLSEIAEEYGTTVSALGSINGIKDVDLIIVGQVLKIPVTSTTAYRVRVTAKNGLNCRTGAGIGSPKVTAFKYGTELTVTAEKNGWGYVGKGWVSLEFVEKVSDTKTYTIQAGDTLSGIAEKYGTTVDALVKANGIKDKNLIVAGKPLIIP